MKKEKNNNLKLAILWIISFGFIAFILFLMCFNSSAASEQDYFPMFQNENGHFSEYDKTAIENRFDAVNNYIFAYFSGYQAGYGERMKVFHILVVPKNSGITLYGEKFTNLYQFSIYGGGGTLTNNMCYQYSILEQNWKYEYSDNLSSFQNLQSSNYDNSIDYVSNMQIMTNNTSSAQVVLFYDDGVTIPDGDTARDDMEKPDINDYIPSWNNKPSFDSSSVENALSSIWDITIWTAENTRDTIKGVGQFIGDTLRWTSQKIIDSIRSKIDEIKTGIVNAINTVSAFVQDIKGFVSYVAEPLDVSSVQTTITGSTAYGDVSTITGAFADFKGVFDSTSEPSEYKIPIHLENIPILNQTQAQYFDLSVISNQRGLIRAFCWVVTTFSLFVTVIDALPNYLKGGDE